MPVTTATTIVGETMEGTIYTTVVLPGETIRQRMYELAEQGYRFRSLARV